jgi:putative cell wall-binding protein
LGTDTFTYRASDGTAHSPAATVTITVALPGGAHRVAGLNRYLTSVAASKRAFLSASTVVVATGDNWPDALGGSALAGAVEGPLLLTSSASLPSGVRDEIVRLKAKKVYVLGGKAAVSDTVLNQIKAISGVTSVERVSGNDRYGTARAIADKAIAELNARGTYSGGALVATGGNFPDATAASPLAASLGWPILLVNPANGSVYVPSSTESALILGGTGVVSTSVESALKSRLGTASVDRAGGANRYETAAKIADKGVAAGMRWNGVGVATGENFPDALAGGAMLGAFDSVMLLTPGSALDTYARGRLQTNAAQIRTLHVVGGTTVVSDPTMAAAKSAAGITP